MQQHEPLTISDGEGIRTVCAADGLPWPCPESGEPEAPAAPAEPDGPGPDGPTTPEEGTDVPA